jgi:large subunit ribosomal protein L4
MPTAKVYDIHGEQVGEQELAEAVFGMPVHTAVLYQVVTAQLWNRRQGNASTKTRAQVSGGNRKPYKQKGTGRARQGSTRAPHFRGGGNVFGPRPHAYHAEVPRKVRRIAMRSALSDKANNERIFVLQDFTMEAPRTRTMIEFFEALELHDEVHAHPSVLVLLAERDENIIYSMRNIPYTKVGHVAAVNVVEIMKHDFLMLTPEAVEFLETTFDDGIPVSDEEDVTTEEA